MSETTLRGLDRIGAMKHYKLKLTHDELQTLREITGKLVLGTYTDSPLKGMYATIRGSCGDPADGRWFDPDGFCYGNIYPVG